MFELLAPKDPCLRPRVRDSGPHHIPAGSTLPTTIFGCCAFVDSFLVSLSFGEAALETPDITPLPPSTINNTTTTSAILLHRFDSATTVIMIHSVGEWPLGTAVPALRVGSEMAGSLLETTTGLVKRGGYPRESKMDYAALAIMIVLVLLAALIFAILYTARILITLTAIEDPTAAYLPLGQSDHKAAAVLGIDTEARHYITSSLFGTLRHLRSEGGFFAPWRGFNAHFFYLFAHHSIDVISQNLLGQVFPGFPARIISGLATSLVFGRFAMVCTHIVISKPQEATWFTRLRSTPWSTARKTLPAVAIVTLLVNLTRELVRGLATVGVDGPTRLIATLAACLLFLGIVLPASATLARVQASHLPENVEPIVPFDRTFGRSDDSKDLTFVEAWKSMGMHGWKRVAKMFVKLAPVAVALPVIFVYGAIFVVIAYNKISL
ncbi:hypothetical protein C7212DRAFT_366662 [Tuber magnatum]|uniref:Uncharacterized protein n=1 Tax=Tuber magnatum TaxID=42249 RepID=A0A317SDF6_9PEZI|nr:hypothetical protein C7212DRAFT_366662 [Tuber magnatum]